MHSFTREVRLQRPSQGFCQFALRQTNAGGQSRIGISRLSAYHVKWNGPYDNGPRSTATSISAISLCIGARSFSAIPAGRARIGTEHSFAATEARATVSYICCTTCQDSEAIEYRRDLPVSTLCSDAGLGSKHHRSTHRFPAGILPIFRMQEMVYARSGGNHRFAAGLSS